MSTIVVGSNSYLSLEEANKIINNEYFDTDDEYKIWSSLSEENKEKLLIKGTRVIDTIPFRGIKVSGRVESLQFPREIHGEVIDCPYEVKVGLLVQALKTYANNGKQELKLQELGVKSYSINKASITFGDTNNTRMGNGIYNEVYDIMKKWVL